ncbi:MAG: methyltransferase [Patescibacteria group bacterium]|jgi:release factor glutamine methyltransferase
MDYPEWSKKVEQQFAKMRKHATPYEVEIFGKKILVLPEVFSPKYFTDSAYFANVIPKLVQKQKLLEIGTGTGIVAVFAALHGATVTATDINPAAVQNCLLNAQRFAVQMDVRESNLFAAFRNEEKFDFIFWNHPFNRAESPVTDILLQSGFDENYNALQQFLKEAPAFLTASGVVLIGTSAYARLDEIENHAKRLGYSIRIVDTKGMLMAEGEKDLTVHRVYACTPKK